jgi:plasmid stabilization system protein ParE
MDLAEELTWLKENAGAEVAERWYQALLASLKFIEQNPLAGRERKDLKQPGIRSWRVRGFSRWLIFYSFTLPAELIFYRICCGDKDLSAMTIEDKSSH